jgi:hypothetical protein
MRRRPVPPSYTIHDEALPKFAAFAATIAHEHHEVSMRWRVAVILCSWLLEHGAATGLHAEVSVPCAGLLRDSVLLRCARWCQLQRVPRGKSLKMQAYLCSFLLS